MTRYALKKKAAYICPHLGTSDEAFLAILFQESFRSIIGAALILPTPDHRGWGQCGHEDCKTTFKLDLCKNPEYGSRILTLVVRRYLGDITNLKDRKWLAQVDQSQGTVS